MELSELRDQLCSMMGKFSINQKELAQRCGVDKMAISRIMNGKSISLTNYAKLVAAVGLIHPIRFRSPVDAWWFECLCRGYVVPGSPRSDGDEWSKGISSGDMFQSYLSHHPEGDITDFSSRLPLFLTIDQERTFVNDEPIPADRLSPIMSIVDSSADNPPPTTDAGEWTVVHVPGCVFGSLRESRVIFEVHYPVAKTRW